MIIKSKCPECGFEFTLYTSDTSIVKELEECDCGAKCELTITKEEGEKNE